ncbi:MAG: tetratricopeptide repeat protein, partial [Candidatus Binataceae bacterium]
MIQRASAALQRGAFGEAAEIARQVVARFGEDANALMILGLARKEAGDLGGAIAFYERARAAMPAHIHVLVNLGAAYR